MANPEHVAKLREGVEGWNEWIRTMRTSPEWGFGVEPAEHFGLDSANLTSAGLSYEDLNGVDLAATYLDEAQLTFSHLNFALLNEAKLRGAKLDGAELRNAQLIGANLRGSDLSHADLNGADLSHSDLSHARLYNTNLNGAKLHHADLGWADLNITNLNNSDLFGSQLIGTVVRGAALGSADLSLTHVAGTVFSDVDLSKVKGLETLVHSGPSILDHRTLERSGRLPLCFLRGCGFSETFIQYIPSIFRQGIEFYSCFISYSTKDAEFAKRLHADLQDRGVRCWFAPHDMKRGQKIHEQIDEAIKVYDRLLLILSEHSMASPWVSTEIGKARKRERALEVERLEAVKRGEAKERRRVLFPVGLVGYEAMRAWECFDGDLGTDSAKEIREYFIPDFSGWETDHDGYQREFERLVRDLKAT